MPSGQDPWETASLRQGGLRSRIRKFVHKRRSLPAEPEYALPLSQPPPPLRGAHPAGLSVQLSIRYRSPLNINFENIYETSRNHVPSDEECHGLLRRLDHGCPELITRRDSAAMSSGLGQKTMRFELTFTVSRHGAPWAVKVYTSYQELPLDRLSALEVAEAADRLVGPYLRSHDKAFRWQPCERLSAQPDHAIPPQGSTVSLVSIPLCRFIFAKQEYESAPGYEINLVFKSQRRPRKPVVWERNVHIKSTQTTPLTLALGEDLTWKISSAVNSLLDARRSIKPEHKPSDESDSDDTRAHLDDDSLHVGFRIRNRIGFDYAHLERATDSRLALFRHPEGLDCQEFFQELERAIATARDEIDTTLGRSDDLKISIRQLSGLSGTYWTVKNPFAVSLDSSVCYSRDTVQAILERVQTGISDVLSGNDVSITFAATKRGHVVLDKTLVAQAVRSSPRRPTSSASDGPDQEALLLALKDRMQTDISMVVRDTCSLVHSTDAPPNLRLIERRFDIPLPSPSTLVAESHHEPVEHEPVEPENPMSVDDVISASLAKFAALDDDTIDSSSETTSKYQPDPETPHRPIPFLKDQQQGISTLRDSPVTPPSYSMTDEADTASTRLSTPCLSDKDTETPQESVANTPNFQYRGQYTFERLVKGDDCGTFEDDEMKLPRRFALLGRSRRPKTPAMEGKSDAAVSVKTAKSDNDVVIVQQLEEPQETTGIPVNIAQVIPAEPTAVDVKSAGPVTEVTKVVEEAIAVKEKPARSQDEAVLVQSKELVAMTEHQAENVKVAKAALEEPIEIVETTKTRETPISTGPQESLELVDFLEPAPTEPAMEAAKADEEVGSVENNEMPVLSEPTKPVDPVNEAEANTLDAADITPAELEAPPALEGFLHYSAEPTADEPREDTGVDDAELESSPESDSQEVKPEVQTHEVSELEAIHVVTAAPEAAVELEAPETETLAALAEACEAVVEETRARTPELIPAEAEAIEAAVESNNPRTPEPQTPVLSSADSTAGDSVDGSTFPFPDLDKAPPSPALSTSSLTLWRPFNPPPIPEDLDLDEDESPSKNVRPSLYARPQSAHANAFFSAPFNISPTASPSPAARRPYLGMHKRQFSSPTAGYLGLLHGRGSPLRMQSYVYSGSGLGRATEEEEEGYSPVVAMQRRSSWALVALRSGSEVDLAARPSSSAGLPTSTTDMPGLRGRSGSTLSASIWLN